MQRWLLPVLVLLLAGPAPAESGRSATERVFIASVATDARPYGVRNPRRLAAMIFDIARKHDLDPYLVAAVIRVESGYDPFAVSRSGAMGLMQVMPFWRKEFDDLDANLMKPEVNLTLGCRILKRYLERYRGDRIRALGAYHGSWPSRRYPRRILAAYHELY